MTTPRDLAEQLWQMKGGNGTWAERAEPFIASAQAEWKEAAEKEGYSKGRLAQLAAQPQPTEGCPSCHAPVGEQHRPFCSGLGVVKSQPAPSDKPSGRCPICGSPEVDAVTPRTVYACGASDYDQRPGTLRPCKPAPSAQVDRKWSLIDEVQQAWRDMRELLKPGHDDRCPCTFCVTERCAIGDLEDIRDRIEAVEAERDRAIECWQGATATHNQVRMMYETENKARRDAEAREAALRADVEGLRAGLAPLAKQPLRCELDEEERENGDYENAYDIIIEEIRALLRATPGEGAALTCEGCKWLRKISDVSRPCHSCKRKPYDPPEEDRYWPEDMPGEGVKS